MRIYDLLLRLCSNSEHAPVQLSIKSLITLSTPWITDLKQQIDKSELSIGNHYGIPEQLSTSDCPQVKRETRTVACGMYRHRCFMGWISITRTYIHRSLLFPDPLLYQQSIILTHQESPCFQYVNPHLAFLFARPEDRELASTPHRSFLSMNTLLHFYSNWTGVWFYWLCWWACNQCKGMGPEC